MPTVEEATGELEGALDAGEKTDPDLVPVAVVRKADVGGSTANDRVREDPFAALAGAGVETSVVGS